MTCGSLISYDHDLFSVIHVAARSMSVFTLGLNCCEWGDSGNCSHQLALISWQGVFTSRPGWSSGWPGTRWSRWPGCTRPSTRTRRCRRCAGSRPPPSSGCPRPRWTPPWRGRSWPPGGPCCWSLGPWESQGYCTLHPLLASSLCCHESFLHALDVWKCVHLQQSVWRNFTAR